MLENEDIAIVRWYSDCGRMGALEGLIALNRDGIDLINHIIDTKTTVYFGEVLGKHSDVYGTLEAKEFTLLATDQKAQGVVEVMCGKFDTTGIQVISGFNPIGYQLCEEEVAGFDRWFPEDGTGNEALDAAFDFANAGWK